jgi:glycosyltransferase involved in cell wall biosynthesis
MPLPISHDRALIHNEMKFGAVAIGRNEGQRLRQCLGSLSGAPVVVYVDSGSTDGSAEWARNHGADVIQLNLEVPFTAARARNAGFLRLRELAPHLPYVQFVDGDCELRECWAQQAISFLKTHADVAAVCGRQRELYPEKSIYNWLCDQEWDGPIGQVKSFGGCVMMRANALEAVGAYRGNLIAGEEPELSVRLRAAGWRIWRLNNEMTLHDAKMMRFGQWWRRTVRAGYAFAEGAYIHGAPPERHWVRESRSARAWGMWLPLCCVATGLAFGPWGWVAWLIYPLQVLRLTVRNCGPLRRRVRLAFFYTLAKFPEAWGQIRFVRDRLLKQEPVLIEYK